MLVKRSKRIVDSHLQKEKEKGLINYNEPLYWILNKRICNIQVRMLKMIRSLVLWYKLNSKVLQICFSQLKLAQESAKKTFQLLKNKLARENKKPVIMIIRVIIDAVSSTAQILNPSKSVLSFRILTLWLNLILKIQCLLPIINKLWKKSTSAMIIIDLPL